MRWHRKDRVDYVCYEGWIRGKYTNWLDLDSDKKPNYLYIVKDPNRDGIGTFDTSNGHWNLGEDDKLYYNWDVLLGDDNVRDDVSKLPAWEDPGTTLYLPEMVMKSFSNLEDLIIMSDNWLMEGCSSGSGSCNGADWNRDGEVNLKDFARLANKWLKL